MTHCEKPAIRVASLVTRYLTRPPERTHVALADQLDWLSAEVVDQLSQVLTVGDEAPVYLCSTILSKFVTGSRTDWASFRVGIERAVDARVRGLALAYQCAGWGFVLRFAARHTGARAVVISIVDTDVHDLLTRSYEKAIGRIGFSVTTVRLDLTPGCELPCCGGALGGLGFTRFLHQVRAMHQQHGTLPTFLPFLPQGLDGVARRLLKESLAPNRHDELGHVFGADPWIALADWRARERPDSPRDVLLGSTAHDGYYAICRFSVDPLTRIEIRPSDSVHRTPARIAA